MYNNNLVKTFISLVAIPSPSGKEGAVAVRIKEYLKLHDISSTFDTSGKVNNSDSGNLRVTILGKNSKTALLFIAHMDTVEKGDKKIIPIIKKGNITSDGTTILGADDKGAVACLIEALGEIKKLDKYPTVHAFFTTREEEGKMGISCTTKIPGVKYAFNLDGQGVQGRFVYKSLGQLVFQVEIMGIAAHSAIDPEKGRNAIAAAAHFISRIKQGRGKNALINIGAINGGKSVNVVSDRVEIKGEIRSFQERMIKQELGKIEKQLRKSCEIFGCTYKLWVLEEASVPVMENTADKKMIQIAKLASVQTGLLFKLIAGSFTTEANFLSAMGYKVLTICRGGTNAHSNKESITEKELQDYKDLIVNIARQSV